MICVRTDIHLFVFINFVHLRAYNRLRKLKMKFLHTQYNIPRIAIFVYVWQMPLI